MAIKSMIITKITRKKEKLLIKRNKNKVALAKFTKTLNSINIDSKYILIIINFNINKTKYLELANIKIY